MQSGSVQYCPVMNGIHFRSAAKLLILNLLRVFTSLACKLAFRCQSARNW